MGFEAVSKHLEERGYRVRIFATAEEASTYLNAEIDGKTVGFGGSVTLRDMGVYESLGAHNTVYWHMPSGDLEACKAAATAQIYLTSVNALAETGELLNIDGFGNRVSGSLYGHEKVYFVVGRNKLASTYDEALWRARNIAAPKNAQRKNAQTPCAVKGDRCYDCRSPQRICRGLAVLWGPMIGMEAEVILVDQDLGF